MRDIEIDEINGRVCRLFYYKYRYEHLYTYAVTIIYNPDHLHFSYHGASAEWANGVLSIHETEFLQLKNSSNDAFGCLHFCFAWR